MVEELGDRVHRERLDDLAQGRLHVVRLVADHRHAQDGQLAVVLASTSATDTLKRVVQPILDALAPPAACPSGCAPRDRQPDSQGADDHRACRLSVACGELDSPHIRHVAGSFAAYRVRCTCSMRYASMTSPTLMSS